MTALVPTNMQVPAHLANRIGAQSALASSISGGLSDGASYPRISLKGSRFRIVEGGNETVLPVHQLEVVIVGANPGLTKTWYAKAWNPDDEPSQPDCQSMNGIEPDADAPQPQSATCAACPQNQWGSKITPNGQKIKACSDTKRLAVVAANAPDGPVFLLQVTPAALKGLNGYHRELSRHGIPPEVAKTVLSFDTDASFPKLKFAFGGFLDATQQASVDALFGTPDVMEVTGELKAIKPVKMEVAKPVLVQPKVVAPPPPPPPPPPQPEPEIIPPQSGAAGAFGGLAAPKTVKVTPKVVKAQPKVIEADDDLASQIAKLMEGLDGSDSD